MNAHSSVFTWLILSTACVDWTHLIVEKKPLKSVQLLKWTLLSVPYRLVILRVQFETRLRLMGERYEHYRLSPIVVDFQLNRTINGKIQIISIDSGRFTEAHIHHKKIVQPVKAILTFHGRNTDNCNGMRYASVLSTAGPGTLPRIFVWVTRNSFVIPWVWLEIFVNTFHSKTVKSLVG